MKKIKFHGEIIFFEQLNSPKVAGIFEKWGKFESEGADGAPKTLENHEKSRKNAPTHGLYLSLNLL